MADPDNRASRTRLTAVITVLVGVLLVLAAGFYFLLLPGLSVARNEPSKLEVGQEHEFKIIKRSVEEKKVGLSREAVSHHAAGRAQVESYKEHAHKAPVSSSTTARGDLINWRKNER